MSQDLRDLGLSMASDERGLSDARRRDHARERATIVAVAVGGESITAPGDRLLLSRAREIMCDAGIEGPITAEKIHVLLHHADATISFHRDEQRDYRCLSRALMVYGHIERTFWGESKAAPRFNWASCLLEEQCYRKAPNDPMVALLYHRGISLDLRCNGRSMTQDEKERKLDLLTSLATTVGDPLLWVEHYRDYAGHVARLSKGRSRALGALNDLAAARLKIPKPRVDLDPTILRARIEHFRESRDERKKKDAIDLIRTNYLGMYLTNRTHYYRQQLVKWFKDFSTLPQAEYFNSYFVPRYLKSLSH